MEITNTRNKYIKMCLWESSISETPNFISREWDRLYNYYTGNCLLSNEAYEIMKNQIVEWQENNQKLEKEYHERYNEFLNWPNTPEYIEFTEHIQMLNKLDI